MGLDGMCSMPTSGQLFFSFFGFCRLVDQSRQEKERLERGEEPSVTGG